MQQAFKRLSRAVVVGALCSASAAHASLTITSNSYYHDLLVPNLGSPPIPVVTQSPGFYEAAIAPQTYDIQGHYPTPGSQGFSSVTDAAFGRVYTNSSDSHVSVQLQTHASRVVNSLGYAEYSGDTDAVLAKVGTTFNLSVTANSAVQLRLNRTSYVASGALNDFPYGLNVYLAQQGNPSVSWGIFAPINTATGIPVIRDIVLPAGNYTLRVDSGWWHGPYIDRFVAPGSMNMTIDFSMTIVPSPGALTLTGITVCAAIRRRR